MNQNSAHIPHSNASAISHLLSNAEQGYVRYFDLLTDVHYLKNRCKRELTARRYALLAECNNLINLQLYTKKEIFEVYKTFKSASISNYDSFLRKLKEFQELDMAACSHKRIGKAYQYKVNPYVFYLVMELLCDPHYYGAGQITEWVNKTIEEFNTKYRTRYLTISQSTVYHYSMLYRNEINYYRQGKRRFDIATRPYLPRIKALNAGSLEQMDGTPVQIFCWNPVEKQKSEGKKLIRLNLFVLRDAYSGKITGFDISESEDRFNVINALKMRAEFHKHLPAELVHDNFSATKTDEFESIKKQLEDKGVTVRAAKVGNPQDKGEIERFFGTFQSRFQRLIDGYVGEGIRSKRANGRISEEFINKHHKENGYYEYDEMEGIIAELVAIYNNSVISKQYGNKTPNQLYEESEKPHIKSVDDKEIAKLFWSNREVLIRRSLIINTVRKVKYIYEVWENEDKLRLNEKKVHIYYNEKDASLIYVYTLDGEFVCTCNQKVQVHEASADRDEDEKMTIIKHNSHSDSIYSEIDKRSMKRMEDAQEFTSMPCEAIIPYVLEKGKLNDAESQSFLRAYFDGKNKNYGKTKEYSPAISGTHSNREKFLKNNKQSGKGIFTSAPTIDGG